MGFDKPVPQRGLRQRQNIRETRHDAYREKWKYNEPTICSDCKAVFHVGRWQWLAVPFDGEQRRCPACQRIHDQLPAGYLTLSGEFFYGHFDEILRLLKHVADHARQEHPLKRIMAIDKMPAGDMLISTTDLHLARELGEAVHHAYQGALNYQYNSGDDCLRVAWQR